MTETDGPGKNEIALVFKKLRAIAGNKSCFDCGASNPTWSSVTYGVFICIDCSAVHRGLGVHLTFVRSTNLDTNWTWLQVRAMQCGGNANAQQFFRQHGCTTTDAQQKYRSRAAQLYRDKLHHLCAQTQRMHGNKLFLDSACQLSPSGAEDVDFFAEHTSSTHSDGGLRHNMSSTSINAKMMLGGEDDEEDTNDHRNGNIPINQKPTDGREPSVDHILTETAPAKPKPASIGTRKPAGAKKMGAKKMGAQKVKANFEELEQKAETIEKEKEQSSRLGMEPEKTVEPEVNKLSERLMIQDMSDKRTKHVEKNFKHDPTKAEQAERLGMGYVRDTKAASHSVASSISVIQQEGIRSKQPTYPKAFQTADTFYDAKDDWEVVSSDPPSKRDDLFGMVESNGSSKKKTTTDFGDSWDNVVDARDDKPKSSFGGYGVKSPVAPTPAAASNYADSDEASKKFGGAKAISSDMFFGNNTTDFETKTTLSKFDGATSISSSDFYGGGPGVGGGGQGGGGAYGYGSGYREQMPDMQDVKDSARAAASKVAGKFSSAMGSVQNYVQPYRNKK